MSHIDNTKVIATDNLKITKNDNTKDKTREMIKFKFSCSKTVFIFVAFTLVFTPNIMRKMIIKNIGPTS